MPKNHNESLFLSSNNHSQLSHASTFQLSNKPSVLDVIDPRAKVLATIIFAFCVVLGHQVAALLLSVVIGIAMACIAKLDFKATLKRLLAMDMFMFVLLVILPFTVKGDVLYSAFGYTASWQGLEQGIIIALKANAVVLMLFSTISTLANSALASTLVWLHVPDKLIQLLFFTLRYLSVIVEEFQRLRRSMRARAFVMGFNWHTWRSLGYLIGMMIVRAMQRSERIVQAMKCRGYTGQYYSYYPMCFKRCDAFYSMIFLVLIIIISYLNFS